MWSQTEGYVFPRPEQVFAERRHIYWALSDMTGPFIFRDNPV